MRRTWIKVKRELLTPEHIRNLGSCWALYLYMIDQADWETGRIVGWKDPEVAVEIEIAERTVRSQRTFLEGKGYITCRKNRYSQTIIIHDWTNPREYSGNVINYTGIIHSDSQILLTDENESDNKQPLSNETKESQSDNKSGRNMSLSNRQTADTRQYDDQSDIQSDTITYLPSSYPHKPHISVDVDSTTTIKKESFETISKKLDDLGLLSQKISQLILTIPLDIISVWIELYPLAKKVRFASKPIWIHTACCYGWNIHLVQSWLADPPGPLPDDVLNFLDRVGWVGPKDEIYYYYHAEPERFDGWVKYFLREIGKGNEQMEKPSGILRDNLRNDISAPKVTQSGDDYRRYIEGDYANFIEH